MQRCVLSGVCVPVWIDERHGNVVPSWTVVVCGCQQLHELQCRVLLRRWRDVVDGIDLSCGSVERRRRRVVQRVCQWVLLSECWIVDGHACAVRVCVWVRVSCWLGERHGGAVWTWVLLSKR